jgi:myo-inositol-1(or 4)-monophosphatase
MIILPKLIQAVKKTGQILEQSFGQQAMGEVLSVGFGGDSTTVADKIAEGALVYELKDLEPEINSEERGLISIGDSKLRLVIDPLDGSTNFSRGIYPWAISVYAEEIDGTPLAGVVYDPMKKSVFYAEKGRGAFQNNSKISAIQRPLEESVASVFLYSQKEFSTITRGMELIRPRIKQFVRHGCGALELCWLASGKLDLFLHLTPDTRPHDYLAGLLILEEAGGIFSDTSGNRPVPGKSSLIAAGSRKNHREILEILKASGNP